MVLRGDYMSYEEYFDLCEKAQKRKKGMLLCVTDVVNSKNDKNYLKYREEYIEKMLKIATCMNAKNINKSFISAYNKKLLIFGDAIGFVIMSKDKENDDYKIKEMIKDIPLQLHYSSLFFETFNWCEGTEKYYIGYAFQQAEKNSKMCK